MDTAASLRLFVLGATGRTGQEIVEEALARNHRVTALVRSPEKIGVPREGLTVVRGNPLDAGAIASVLGGHDAVLSAIGPPGVGPSTVTSACARAAITGMRAAGVRRLLVVGVAMLFDDGGALARLLRSTLLRNVAQDSARMEEMVQASGLDWTIVRPPRLTNGAARGQYGVADDHLPPGSGGGAAKISRADVAHFLLREAERPQHVRRVAGVAYTRGA
ncbi:SDR family oxidoreductase [Acidobacteria bacterium AB60]|nr:SDR family oxidoreductase [Acidobacteria bacterium AB60]